jgi:hypothetical protein
MCLFTFNSKRKIRAEAEELPFVAGLFEKRDAEVECDGGVAELRDVQANAGADRHAILIEAGVFGHGAGIDEHDASECIAKEGEFILRSEREQPLAADGIIACLAVVSANALGADGAEIKAAQGATAEVKAFVGGYASAAEFIADARSEFQRGKPAEEIFIHREVHGVLSVGAIEIEIATERAETIV